MKYNETLFLFIIFLIDSFDTLRSRAFCCAVEMHQNPFKCVEFVANGGWLVPSRRVPQISAKWGLIAGHSRGKFSVYRIVTIGLHIAIAHYGVSQEERVRGNQRPYLKMCPSFLRFYFWFDMSTTLGGRCKKILWINQTLLKMWLWTWTYTKPRI